MTKTQQTITIVIVSVVLGGGAIGWGLIKLGQSTIDSAAQRAAEGTQFGKQTDNNGCVERALALDATCSGLTCLVETAVFFSSCLDSSERVPGFCDSVPDTGAILDSVNWRVQQCARLENTSSQCPQLFASVQTYCAE